MYDNRHFSGIRIWFFAISIALATFFIPYAASAGGHLHTNPLKSYFKQWEQVNIQFGVTYHHFTDDGMNEAYTGCMRIPFWLTARGEKILSLDEKEIEKPFKNGFRIEVDLLFAAGEPLQKDPDWVINKSQLALIALPAAVSYIYRLVGDASDSFVPYCGLGLGGFFGFERISADVYRRQLLTEPHYEWHDTCYRHSFAGHACLGFYIRLDEQYGLLLELRWTQAGKGTIKRGKLSAEQLDEGWGEVFDDFQHPDFNFTGPSASLTLRW